MLLMLRVAPHLGPFLRFARDLGDACFTTRVPGVDAAQPLDYRLANQLVVLIQ